MQPLQSMSAVIQTRHKSDRPWHRGLRPLLFTNNVTGSFTSPSDWCVRMKETRPGQRCPPARLLIYLKQVWGGGGEMEKRAYLMGGGRILKHPEEGINSPKRTKIGISEVACSRRSAVVETGQGAQKWRGHWGEKERTSPQFPLLFFSLALFFVCAPLSERLRQTTGEVNTVSPLMQSSSWGICTHFSAPP